MKSNNRRTRCLFCLSHNKITIHHNYSYDLVREFLLTEFGAPKTEEQHKKRQSKIARINHEGGIVPACDKHHKAWEKFIRGRSFKKNWQMRVKGIIERNITHRKKLSYSS